MATRSKYMSKEYAYKAIDNFSNNLADDSDVEETCKILARLLLHFLVL